MFDNNFGKCGPISKILSPGDSQEKNSLRTTYIFSPRLQYVATLPYEILKSKKVAEFLR